MSALPLPDNVFKLPKRPRIIEKAAPPDQRSLAVLPIRAIGDDRLTDGQFRTLATVCSYANRAGITWVSQARLATDLKVSQQAISKQMRALVALGYIEVTRKGFRGEKPNTTRVIYSTEISQADAIAITSSIEDTRPPEIKREETKAMEEEFTEEQMAANRKRLKELLTGLKPKNHTTHQPVQIGAILMPKPKRKSTTHSQPNTVVNETTLHSQPHSQPKEVVENTKNVGIDRLFKSIGLEITKELKQVLEECLDSSLICTTFDEVRRRYESEGLAVPRNPATVVEMMILIGADASLTRSDGATRR